MNKYNIQQVRTLSAYIKCQDVQRIIVGGGDWMAMQSLGELWAGEFWIFCASVPPLWSQNREVLWPLLVPSDGNTRRPAEVVERSALTVVCGLTNIYMTIYVCIGLSLCIRMVTLCLHLYFLYLCLCSSMPTWVRWPSLCARLWVRTLAWCGTSRGRPQVTLRLRGPMGHVVRCRQWHTPFLTIFNLQSKISSLSHWRGTCYANCNISN